MARRAQGEGSIYWDEKRGRWIAQAWINGRRRTVSALKKPDAAAKLSTLVHGTPGERAALTGLTLAQVLEEWQKHYLPTRALAPSTVMRHRWAADLWIERLGTAKASNVTPVEIREALAGMELASASLSKVRATLQQAYSWSEGQQLVDRNPAKYADLPTPEPARSKRALTDAELLALEETARDHLWWPMWAMSAYIGLRPGEAGAVCVDAIDLEADPPTIAVVRGLQRQRSGAVELVDELKTEAARRTIAMPAHLAATLNAHIGRQGTSGGLLFRAANDGPVHASTVRAELKILCEAAGIEPITPNELRHTAATRFAASGLPPHHLADILGHRTSRMVDEVYRHRPPVIRGPESV